MGFGFIVSAALPALHHAERPADSLMSSGLGILIGAGSVFAVLQLGKLLFGRFRVPLGEGESAIFSESALHLPDEIAPYEEIFFRNSDTIRLHREELSARPLLRWRLARRSQCRALSRRISWHRSSARW